MRNICAVAAVLVTAVAMAQTSAPSQPGGPSPQAASGSPSATAAGPNSAPGAPGTTAQKVATSSDVSQGNTSSSPVDRAIERQVAAQFAHKAEFQDVKVSVVDGVVTLEGSVPTKIERRQAKALARSVNGVKKVQERLTTSGAGVAGPGTYANTETTAQNNAGTISGNAAANAAAAQGTNATARTSDTGVTPNSNAGMEPAAATPGNVGGMTGTAVGNTPASAPPSSNIGAGAQTTQGPPPPMVRATGPKAAAPGTANFGLSPVDPAGLASKINTALKNEPTLAKNHVMVNVSDQGIEVTGNVDTGKEKLTAMRIAQSYAGNFKVVDRVTLAGHPAGTNAQQNTTNQPTQANSSTPPPQNVVGNQVLPAGTASNTPTRDPKTAGDKSNNPR
jgi:osmotically-inducible protein OsmY